MRLALVIPMLFIFGVAHAQEVTVSPVQSGSVAMYFTTWALTDLLSVVVVAFGLHAVQPDLPWWLVVPAISSLVLLRRWIENRLTSENKKHRWAWKIFYALVFITMAGLGIAGMFWLIQAIPTLVS